MVLVHEDIGRDRLPGVYDDGAPETLAKRKWRIPVALVDKDMNELSLGGGGDGVGIGVWELDRSATVAAGTPSGQYRMDNASSQFSTLLWVHTTDNNSNDRTDDLINLKGGDILVLHEGTKREVWRITEGTYPTYATGETDIIQILATVVGFVAADEIDDGETADFWWHAFELWPATWVAFPTASITSPPTADWTSTASGIRVAHRSPDGKTAPLTVHRDVDTENLSQELDYGSVGRVSTVSGPGQTGQTRRIRGTDEGEQIGFARWLGNAAQGIAFPSMVNPSSVKWTEAGTTDPPASGQWSKDNADPDLATTLFIHEDDNGTPTDRTAVLSRLKAGDIVYIQRVETRGQYLRFLVTGDAVLDTNHYEIPVTLLGRSNSNIGSGGDCEISFIWGQGSVGEGAVQARVPRQHQLGRSGEGVDTDWSAVYEHAAGNPNTTEPESNQFLTGTAGAATTDPSLVTRLRFGFSPDDGGDLGRFLVQVRKNASIIIQDQTEYGVRWGRYQVREVLNLTATSAFFRVERKNSSTGTGAGAFVPGDAHWCLFRKVQTGTPIVLGALSESPVLTTVSTTIGQNELAQVFSGSLDSDDSYAWDYNDGDATGDGTFYVIPGFDLADTVLAMHVNKNDAEGDSQTVKLGSLAIGDEIAIANIDDPTQAARFVLDGAPTDQTTYWLIPVRIISQSIETPSDGTRFRLVFTSKAAPNFPVTFPTDTFGDQTTVGGTSTLVGTSDNASRLIIQNHGPANIYLGRGEAASLTTSGLKLHPGGVYIEQPDALGRMFWGNFYAISDGANCQVGNIVEAY